MHDVKHWILWHPSCDTVLPAKKLLSFLREADAGNEGLLAAIPGVVYKNEDGWWSEWLWE